MPELEVIIGLEVHAQMSTQTKMFCSCSNDAFGKAPNTTVCPICMGHPGTLPVPNTEAIAKAMKASLALGCTVHEDCHFDRKHYFYPDLPFGYQISQYDYPLATKGEVHYDLFDDSGSLIGEKVCGITRLHMENDAGKLTHRGAKTLCDYNRAGTPLMEIVTEPDLRSSEEATAFAQELRKILIAVDSSHCDMFKGMMRFDASISLREVGTSDLNPRSEIKNLNSFKALEKALQYEEKRLRKQWDETGGPLPNDITVGWQDDLEKTRILRDKETAGDYRYFPDPDIPPLHFVQAEIDLVKENLPTLPREQRQHIKEWGLSDAEAQQLSSSDELLMLFSAVYEKTQDAKRTSSLVLTQLMGFLNAHEKSLEEAPSPAQMLELVGKIDDGTISSNSAKTVLEKMVETSKDPSVIIEEEGMGQISDDSAIEELVVKAMDANPKAVEDFKAGKMQAIGAIVGFVMKESRGQADPKKVNEILRSKIS